MIFYLYVVGLAFIFLGGASAYAGDFWVAAIATGFGACMVGLIDATRERLLREVTARLTAWQDRAEGKG